MIEKIRSGITNIYDVFINTSGLRGFLLRIIVGLIFWLWIAGQNSAGKGYVCVIALVIYSVFKLIRDYRK